MSPEGGTVRVGAERPRVVVVGAGFSGLSAAYELAKRGLRPIVLEAAAEVGGLAATFQVDGARLERFYHHWFTNDQHVVELVGELGLQDRIVYKATRTGMYFANQIYRLSTPLDVLRFPALPLSDRVRLGLTVLRARRVKNWREIDHLGAAEWLRRLGGDRAFRVVWEPLLRGKFGPHAEDVSAAWFWSKLRLRGGSRGARGEEQLAYFRGGFAALADELVKRITRSGGQVRLRTSARGLITENGRVTGVTSETESIRADAAILTPALPIIAELMKPHVNAAYADRIGAIDYLANVCVVLELTRSLSELYWMNVNDPAFPFVGIIEHTNLDQADPSGRRHVVYFSRYLPASDPMFGAPDDHIIRLTMPHIQRMFPEFDPGSIRAAHVWQARYAQPLVIRNYSQLIPPHRTPITGVFIASMAQVYPEDRGTNYAIRDGRAVALLAANSLSAVDNAQSPAQVRAS
jgi:protoporphyrinogen oxidase